MEGWAEVAPSAQAGRRRGALQRATERTTRLGSRKVAEQHEGLDFTRLDEISPEEVNANLMHVWSWRGPLYELYANSLMLDYDPAFAKLHRWQADFFGRP